MIHAVVRGVAAALLCTGAVVTLAGCGSKGIPVAPTEGVVLLDGKPVAGVSVVFRQAGLSMVASGKTDSEGHFQLSTYGDLDGAPVGDCVATVESVPMDQTTVEQEVPMRDTSSITDPDERAAANRAAKGERMQKISKLLAERNRKNPPAKIPLRYSKAETSSLNFKVSARTNNKFEISLTK